MRIKPCRIKCLEAAFPAAFIPEILKLKIPLSVRAVIGSIITGKKLFVIIPA